MASLFAILILLAPAAVCGQSFWLERDHGKSLGLEIFKPDLQNSYSYPGYDYHIQSAFYPVDYSFKTFALFLSLRWQMGNKTFLVAELPFAHAEFDTEINEEFSFFRNSGYESTAGNPYLGLEFGALTSPFFAEAGIRLPLVAEDHIHALRAGEVSDLDRKEAFLDFATIKAAINYQRRGEAGLVFRLRVGASFSYKHGDSIRRLAFAITPAARVGYKTGRVGFGAYINVRGEAMNTQTRFVRTAFNRGANTNFQTTGQVGLWANIDWGRLQPGVYLNDALTLHLAIQFR